MDIADKTILNVIAKASEAVLLLISSIVFARYLSKADYGTFLQIMLIVNTTIMLTFVGFPQSIYYYFPRIYQRDRFIIRNVLVTLIIGAGAGTFVYLIKTKLASLLNNDSMVTYGWVMAILLFFRALSNLREPILISNKSLILNSLITTIANTVFFIPAIVAAVMGKSLRYILFVMLICSFVEFFINTFAVGFIVLAYRRKKKEYYSASVDDKKDVSLKRQIFYALPIGVSSYVSVIGRQIDQYIVSAFFTPGNFAVYSRGAMQIPVLSSLHFTINNVIMPQYVESFRSGDTVRFLKYFHTCIEKVAKINFPVFAFLFAISPSFITLLYTEDYIDANWIFRCYLFSLIINIAVYGIIPRASGKTGYIVKGTSLSLGINIMFSLILIKIIGVLGAALATLFSGIVGSSYLLFCSCKVLKISFKEIFPWKYLTQIFVYSMIASVPVWILEGIFKFQGHDLAIFLFIEWVIFTYLYIFLMARKNMIHPDEIELLSRWLHFNVGKFLSVVSLRAKH